MALVTAVNFGVVAYAQQIITRISGCGDALVRTARAAATS